MSERSEHIKTKMLPNGNIYGWQDHKKTKPPAGEWCITDPKNICPSVIKVRPLYILIYEQEE